MRARSLSLWAAVALLVLVSGAWAQSNDAGNAQYISVLKQKAAKGDAKAQYDLGTAYMGGFGVPQEDAKVAFWDRKAAEQGYAKAQADLGVMYELGSGVQQDSAEAVKWYSKASEQGDAFAQTNLGRAYATGHGVQQDYAHAAVWYRKAAEQEHSDAQVALARLYLKGQGVPKDHTQAAFWFRKAAEQGNTDAQFNLALQLMNGWGVSQDTKQAMVWFQKAAEQGNSESQYMLGQLYEDGGMGKLVRESDGSSRVIPPGGDAAIPKDFGQAAKWYRKAADQGNALAQNHLGSLYAEGNGVPQDYAEAYFWLSLANSSGSHSDTNGVDDRDLAASHLTKTVLLETQERTRKWFAAHPSKTQ
jgi:uncharacterized protein